MCYRRRHETSSVCACAQRRGAPPARGWLTLVGGRGAAAQPDRVGQCPRRACATDRPSSRLLREDGAPGHPALQRAGRGRAHAWLHAAPSGTPAGVRGRAGRAVAGPVASQPTGVRQARQPVDFGVGGRGEFCRGRESHPHQRRDYPPDFEASGGGLEARQALDYQPRPGVPAKKRQRDRLIQLTEQQPDWALGFLDETWWSRLARPALHAWVDTAQPLRLLEQTVAQDDPDPKALAGYGLLVRRSQQAEQVWLRFVDGRPVSAVTTQFLAWCCTKLETLGVRVWTLIWDNASWHVSK